MKRIIALFLFAVMITTFSSTVSAAVVDPGEIISPNWAYMGDVILSIDFSGTTGTAGLTVDRIALITKSLSATLTVYKKVGTSWVYVDSASTTSSRMLVIDLDFSAESSATYKAVADITAYGTSGGSESDTLSTIETCP